jgi:hypothetical protein
MANLKLIYKIKSRFSMVDNEFREMGIHQVYGSGEDAVSPKSNALRFVENMEQYPALTGTFSVECFDGRASTPP